MPQLPLPLDALTAAVTPYLEDPLSPADPAATLAALIDLAGGVALAEGLVDVEAAAPSDGSAGRARAALDEGSAHIDRQLASAFANAWKPRYRLPRTARALQTFQDAGVAEAEGKVARRKAIKTMARVLWAPFNEYLETQLKRGRFALRDLREEVLPELIGLGPDAARLVRLDAALRAGTLRQVEAVYRRVPYAWALAFERHLQRAVEALPPHPTLADFEPWFGAGGWVPSALTEGQQLVLALVARERRRLATLIEAACGAATPR